MKTRRRLNPLRLDPTRLAGPRRAFVARVRRGFRRLRKRVYDLVAREDAFGLRPPAVALNRRWAFRPRTEQLAAFKQWLAQQFAADLINPTEEELWRRYVEEGFRKGAARSFDDVAARTGEGLAQGAREQFLRDAFRQPVAVEKVQLLASRTFDELEGVTEAMSRRMVRTLADGLVQGKGPREVARDLARNVEGIGEARAVTIARTELIRSHAEGQLVALEQLGVEQLGVQVEWLTSGMGTTALGNPSPCDICAPMEGKVFTLDEARGRLPAHPN